MVLTLRGNKACDVEFFPGQSAEGKYPSVVVVILAVSAAKSMMGDE